MDILIMTIGSRGDIQPYTALGVGLREAGHEVTLATHEPFRGFVTEHGLGFAPLPGDPQEVLQTEAAQELFATGKSMVRFARRFLGVLRPWFDQLIEASRGLVAGRDLVLYSPLAFTAWHQAQRHGVPAWLATLQPFSRTTAFSTVSNGGADLGGPLNLASHVATEQLFWQPLRSHLNEWRSTELGLPPHGFFGPYRDLRRRADIQLCGFSSALVPPPPDWPDHVEVTGPWVLEQEPVPDPDLDTFIEAGEAPVYLGFGSTVTHDPEELSNLAVDAARRAGRRLVLGSGWGGLSADLGPDVHVVGETPHQHLFPRVAAVVHHGGAGTTHTAARAGVPQVIVPFWADQPFWARRVHAVGAGPPPVPRENLDSGSLARAIRSAVEPSTADGARALATRMAREPGVAGAVEIVERNVG
jgi:UDP:flavonoid glycosyltransferase YjiC (YdhE family)